MPFHQPGVQQALPTLTKLQQPVKGGLGRQRSCQPVPRVWRHLPASCSVAGARSLWQHLHIGNLKACTYLCMRRCNTYQPAGASCGHGSILQYCMLLVGGGLGASAGPCATAQLTHPLEDAGMHKDLGSAWRLCSHCFAQKGVAIPRPLTVAAG